MPDFSTKIANKHDDQHDVNATAKRQIVATVLLITVFLLTYFINYILPCINIPMERWTLAYQFPVIGPPIGIDFHYVYQTAGDWWQHGRSPYINVAWYPPIVFIAALPLTLLPYYAAYLVYTVGLIVCHLFCLFMAGTLVVEIFKERQKPLALPIGLLGLLIALIGWQSFSGYAFSFSLERGSNDIIAMALIMMGVWLLVKEPKRPWLTTLAFSAASFIKIYPLIFFAGLFWRYRRQALMPTLVFMIGFSCITGPHNAWLWIKGVMHAAALDHYMWVGNHSGISFFRTLFPEVWQRYPSWGWGFLLLPLALWALAILQMKQQSKTARHSPLIWVVYLLLSLPPMLLVPTISHDHKLVILAPAMAILATLLLINYIEHNNRQALLQLALLLVLLAIINRSPYEFSNPYLANKYPLIICLQLLLIMVLAKPQGILEYSPQKDNN